MSEKAKGRKQDPAVVAHRNELNRGKTREKKLCPHCNQYIAVNGYARFHGEKCKISQTN